MSQQVLDIVDEERARFNLSRSAYINTLIGAKHEEMSNSAIVSAISGNSKLERSNE